MTAPLIPTDPEDDRIARAIWSGIKEGPWKVFPPYNPNDLPSPEQFHESQLDLCRFVTLCAREAFRVDQMRAAIEAAIHEAWTLGGMISPDTEAMLRRSIEQ